MEALWSILWPLLLTQGMECGVSALLFRSRSVVYGVFLCNLLTNPAVQLLILLGVRILGYGWYWPLVAVLELAVFWVESVLLRLLCGWPFRKAALVSLLLNGISYGAGVLVQL